MRSTLTLMGMYRTRPDIFDLMHLPATLDRDMMVNGILLECAELEVLYSNPDFFKLAVENWSARELESWEWLISTQKYDYNPIWNVDVHDSNRYDRKETRNLAGTNYETRDLHGTNNETRDLHGTNNETRDLHGTNNETRDLHGTNNETKNLQGTNNETRNLASTDSGTVNRGQSGTDVSSNYVSAYNDTLGETLSGKTVTTYGKNELETRNLSGSDTGTDNVSSTETGTDNFTSSNTGTDNFTSSNTGTDNYTSSNTGTDNFASSNTGTDKFDTTDTGTIDHNDKEEFYKRGNYGQTTTQEMIKQEQELAKINFDDYIIDQFKAKFCLLVY